MIKRPELQRSSQVEVSGVRRSVGTVLAIATASSTEAHTGRKPATAALTLGALGVVYGDIGTSPLYAIREVFTGHGGRAGPELTEANILGVLSLTFWALILVISLKYLAVVMRADNQGEGGILALTALVRPSGSLRGSTRMVVLLGLFGAALLYGDGMITPAISVLSAVEGTKEVTPAFGPYVVPIAIAILIGLFAVQKRGTAAVGRVFGPIVMCWFVVMAILGLIHIGDDPSVFRAINPSYGYQFLSGNGTAGLLALGSVFLVVTGGEALYADMGHFGRRPILNGWYLVVLPALFLNYLGQGALILDDPSAIAQPFYRLAPRWALWPVVILATMATVIASQALISGVFSITRQAIQLGYLPRMQVTHTSETEEGQIYVATVNWALMAACIALVVGFQTSTNLAAAYGLAVTATMAVTTILFYRVARTRMGWPVWAAAPLCSLFLLIDVAFLSGNIPKIPDGGWLPIVVGAFIMLALTTWFAGRKITSERLADRAVPIEDIVARIERADLTRTRGVGAYLGSNPNVVPQALESHLRHAGALPKTVMTICMTVESHPHVELEDRIEHRDLGSGINVVRVHLGYADDVDLPEAIRPLADELGIDVDRVTWILGRETLKVTNRPGMAIWREKFFVLMMRNSTPADTYFRLPPDRTVELGVQVEL